MIAPVKPENIGHAQENTRYAIEKFVNDLNIENFERRASKAITEREQKLLRTLLSEAYETRCNLEKFKL